MPKSIHITWSDSYKAGGGSIAAQRTVAALRFAGAEAEMLSQDGRVPGHVLPPMDRADRALQRFTSRLGIHDVHLVSSRKVLNLRSWTEADVIHLHIIHSGVFNYLLLPWLTRGKRLFMTLHDMWSFTGNCIYSYECTRYETGCGNCPYPDRYPAMIRDGSRWGWLLKHWVWSLCRPVVIAPSRWLANAALGGLPRGTTVHHIPYPIDAAVYQPLERGAFRASHRLEDNDVVLMFAAHGLDDFRKGGDYLFRAVSALPQSTKKHCVLMLVGNGSIDGIDRCGIRVLQLGFLTGDAEKAAAYSAADLFLFASRADNLPLVIMEAMACATPVIATSVGGIPDLVEPNVTGALVDGVDSPEMFASVVDAWVNSPAMRSQASMACRQRMETQYSYSAIGSKLGQLYRQATQPKSSPSLSNA